MLEVISSSKIFETDFERYCQITHISALLGLDEGQYPGPRLILEKLLVSGRDRNNRKLLWVYIDLANILRDHGEEDEAIMLFSQIFEPIPRGGDQQYVSQELGNPFFTSR